MPKIVVKEGNVVVTVDGSDISEFVQDVDVDTSRSAKDASGLGSKFEEMLAGLRAAKIDMHVYNDPDSGGTNDIFDALADSDTPVEVKVEIVGGKIYHMPEALLLDWHPLVGKAGEPAVAPANFVNAGQQGIVPQTT